MPLTVHCPSGHAFLAPESYIGREVRCPFCQQMTVVREQRTADAGKPTNSASVPSSELTTPQREASTVVFRKNQALSSRDERPSGAAVVMAHPQAISATTLVGLTFVALSNLVPAALAVWQNDWSPWPFVLAGIALLELSATVLLLLFPDWSSLRMTGLLFGVVAGLFGMAAAFLAFASEAKLQAWAIPRDSQDAAGRWMISLMAIQATTAFLCFRAAETWRRRTTIIFSRRSKPRPHNRSA